MNMKNKEAENSLFISICPFHIKVTNWNIDTFWIQTDLLECNITPRHMFHVRFKNEPYSHYSTLYTKTIHHITKQNYGRNFTNMYTWREVSIQITQDRILPGVLLATHIRTVRSSLADANIWGFMGFQLTELTVIEWPDKTWIGFSWCRCQI